MILTKLLLPVTIPQKLRLTNKEEYDKERTEYLESKNINVLRFWNSEIEKDLKRQYEIMNYLKCGFSIVYDYQKIF